MDYNKNEDAIFKKAMNIFQQSAVSFFNINTKIIAPAQTELKNIDIKTSYTDFLFYTSDGGYLHFEFQTTNKSDDIKRFTYYDASLHYRDRKKIRTIIVYSSDIDNVDEYLDAGSIKYGIEAFYMKNLDYNSNLQYLEDKINNGELLSDNDILKLTFLPLMSGYINKSDKAIKSIELAEKIKNDVNKTECISMLYALLDKFGDEKSKKKFMEVFSMTEIGKMIREEGIKEGLEKGMEKGIEKGKADVLIKLLIKKFGRISDEYEKNIRKLSSDTIEIITLEILDMKDIKELEKYF
jgi:predicted transposase/invertase (TIGR01784 family)